MKIQLTTINWSEFWEVWKITELRENCIYKTKNTNSFIHKDNIPKLNPKLFTTTPINNKIRNKIKEYGFTEVDLFNI